MLSKFWILLILASCSKFVKIDLGADFFVGLGLAQNDSNGLLARGLKLMEKRVSLVCLGARAIQTSRLHEMQGDDECRSC